MPAEASSNALQLRGLRARLNKYMLPLYSLELTHNLPVNVKLQKLFINH